MPESVKPKAKRDSKRECIDAAMKQGDMLDRIRELEQVLGQHVTLRKLSSYLKASLTPAEAYAAIE